MNHIKLSSFQTSIISLMGKYFLLCCLMTTVACTAQDQAAPAAEAPAVDKTQAAEIPTDYDCRLHGMQLEGGTYWMADKQMLFAIAAQGEDINGNAPKYRTFQVYTTHDCNMISYTFMPGNLNNEPSLLQPHTYEANNEVLCAQGYAFTYCFDVKYREFITPMAPKYRSPRSPAGADRGKPMGLAVLDHALFAMAKQNGTYAYDLSDKKNIQPLLPKAEYVDVDARTTRQLFVLRQESEDKVIIPLEKNGQLSLKSLLPAGTQLLPRITPDRRSGRYAIARTKEAAKWMVFDLKEGKMLDLPKEIDDTKKVLDYIDKKLY